MSSRRASKVTPAARHPSKAKKTPPKSPLPPRESNGGLLLTGNPGNKGGTGRPPLAFKNFIAQLRQDPDVQNALARALKNEESKAYGSALRVIVDYDEELPANITPEQRKKRVLELAREGALRQKRA